LNKCASNILPSFEQIFYSKPSQINDNRKMTNDNGQHGHLSSTIDSPNDHVSLLPAINIMPAIPIPVRGRFGAKGEIKNIMTWPHLLPISGSTHPLSSHHFAGAII